MADTQRTLVLLKPDAVQRMLVGELISRFERKGLKIVGMKLIHVTEDLAGRHYAAHADKSFFPGLIRFITASPLVALVLEGPDAIDLVRKLTGATRPSEALPGSIRGDFALMVGTNLVHASDAEVSAKQEIELWFQPEELTQYVREVDNWITES